MVIAGETAILKKIAPLVMSFMVIFERRIMIIVIKTIKMVKMV
jgi:hypothetical protein